jgi:hypothetical protein
MGGRFIVFSMLLLLSTASGRADDAGSAVGEQQESALTPEQERLQKQKRVLEAMESERRSRQQQKDQVQKEQQEASVNCAKAREELSRRQNARYLYRKGEDGEQEVLSEEERAKSTGEVEAAVKKWCK